VIKLRFTHRKFLEFPLAGTVLHLKIVSFDKERGGSYDLAVEDVTPLPSAQVMYFCTVCQDCIPALDDGSLPEGWTERKFEKGSCVVCPECEGKPVCKICGCTDTHACDDHGEPCHWVEEDLCSACATPKK
jgi:hypothetical protein